MASASASAARRGNPQRAIRVTVNRMVAPMISCSLDAEDSTALLYQLPLLPEKSSRDNLARVALVGRGSGIHDGVVRDLRDLARVVKIVVLAEREAAVQHDVFLRIQRIGINQDGGVRRRRPLFA